jgi:adenosylcobinamide kinase/adenosylcobinamide-phosphate guanylyltransferase
MEKRFIVVTGGTKSGKSGFAVKLAHTLGNKVVFLATCIPRDEEMKKRVALHQKSRPPHWKTFEEEGNVVSVLKEIKNSCQVVIIDCLTLFISNLLLLGKSDKEIRDEVEKTAREALIAPYNVIMVTNEVGGGLVPENELGRRFRDIAGEANQIVAGYAQEVYLMVSGIPIKIKG